MDLWGHERSDRGGTPSPPRGGRRLHHHHRLHGGHDARPVDMDPSGTMGPGGAGYGWAKKKLIGYTEQMASTSHRAAFGQLHPSHQREHPPPAQRGAVRNVPSRPGECDHRGFTPASQYFQALPISWLEPEDVADLVLFLASDESKNITGTTSGSTLVPSSSSPMAPGRPAPTRWSEEDPRVNREGEHCNPQRRRHRIRSVL